MDELFFVGLVQFLVSGYVFVALQGYKLSAKDGSVEIHGRFAVAVKVQVYVYAVHVFFMQIYRRIRKLVMGKYDIVRGEFATYILTIFVANQIFVCMFPYWR